MLRRRAFRPALCDVLEGRIALSGAAGAGAQPATATPTSANYEELTTTYKNDVAASVAGVGSVDGTTQTEYRLTMPTGSNTATTTESINLAGGAGHETAVDESTKQGNTTTENITTTLPDGTITTKTEILNSHGRTTTIEAWLTTPGVGIQTTRGKTVHDGERTVTTELIHTAAGNVYHYRRVKVKSSPLEYSTTSTTTGPSGAVTNRVNSTTTIEPLPLPTSQS